MRPVSPALLQAVKLSAHGACAQLSCAYGHLTSEPSVPVPCYGEGAVQPGLLHPPVIPSPGLKGPLTKGYSWVLGVFREEKVLQNSAG